MNYSVPDNRPVSPAQVDAIAAVAKAAGEREIPFLLVGAMARDILLWHVHGHRSERQTLDLDPTSAYPWICCPLVHVSKPGKGSGPGCPARPCG
jgi:hypothetical protein